MVGSGKWEAGSDESGRGALTGPPTIHHPQSTLLLLVCLRGTLRERPFEDGLSNAVLEDLDRAAGNHPATALAEAPLDQRLLGVAHAAHDLHRFRADLETDLVAEGLGDRGFLGR